MVKYNPPQKKSGHPKLYRIAIAKLAHILHILKYTTQNLISIKVLFSIQHSVKHPGFDNPQEARITVSLIFVRKSIEATD